jgi:hypothetical protein
MDGKLATLAGAAALAAVPALASATPQASESAVPVAATYAELLNPIANAPERLRIADAQEQSAQPQLIEAQYLAHHHHHHHHHVNGRAWYLSHGYFWSGGRWALRPRHHHHHHHHNHY